MLKDDLGVFLVEVSKIYPIDSKQDYDSVIKQTLEYLFDYCKGKEIDLSQAKKYVFDNYSYKYFPEPAFLKEALTKNVKHIEKEPEQQRLMLLILPDGYIYQYTVDDCVSDFQINDFRLKMIEKHGDRTQVNIYPKGSTLIGKNTVYIPEGEKNKVICVGG